MNINPQTSMWLNVLLVAATSVATASGAPAWLTAGAAILGYSINVVLHGVSSAQPGPLAGGK